MRVFVPYQSEDKDKVFQLRGALEKQGIELSLREITREWESHLPEDLAAHHFVLVYFHDSLPGECWFSLICGYILGSRVPAAVYISRGAKLPPYLAPVPVYSRIKDLSGFLLEKKKIRQREQEILAAERKLETLGYSFNKDAFAFAVSEGDVQAVELFLKGGLSARGTNGKGTPLLCVAARKGFEDLLGPLLKAGADINALSSDRANTALMDAASQGNGAIVKFLIDSGAELDHKSRSGQTALILAVGQKNVEAARVLIQAKADTSITDSLGMDALKYARLFKLEALEELLLEKKLPGEDLKK